VKERLLKNWHILGHSNGPRRSRDYNAICHNATPNVQGSWMLIQDCSHGSLYQISNAYYAY